MIKSFATQGSRDIYNGESTKAARRTLPQALWDNAAMLLDQLNRATSAADMRVPPSNRLHPLKDDRKGQYSVSINKQYRVCFTFKDGNAFDVEITDYH